MVQKPLSPKQLRKLARERFLLARKAEGGFQRQLSAVSNQVGALVRGFAPKGDWSGLRDALAEYARIIRKWAPAVVRQMHEQVSRRDLASWIELGRTMGRELRKEIVSAPTGIMLQNAMAEQVELITSLPVEAAERVHELAREAIVTGERAETIQAKIMETGHVTLGRAKTIARTEVARTASLLTESRARFIGSEGYTWRTARDSDVRREHRILEGKFIRWDEPPVAGPSGERYHAGQGPNCRCYSQPEIPD
jgi:SPP1 gp7 family putative phage head morphogenesis protein